MQALRVTPERRLRQAFSWARALGLAGSERQPLDKQLEILAPGKRWLAGGLQEQYDRGYDILRRLPPEKNDDIARPDPLAGFASAYGYMRADEGFLGSDLVILRAERGRGRNYYDARPEDYRALRSSINRSLGILPMGIFHRLDSVVDHLAFEGHNPLLLGRGQEDVLVFESGRPVPPLVERSEEAGQALLTNLVLKRLIPLECLQTGVDHEGRVYIARLPRFDAYFGRASSSTEAAGQQAEQSRVVVQPDFSIIVIGPNPAPAAELAPFCDRQPRSGSHGVISLKLSRESVIRAVGHGVKPEEIVGRLQRLASNTVPPNVLRQVSDWGGRVRQVQASTETLVRCPDAVTADRVQAALKRRAERISETVVAIHQQKLTSADRNKLKEQGIILEASHE